MALPIKKNSLLKSLLLNSAPYSLALFAIVLCLLDSIAVARGENAEKLGAIQVQTVADLRIQPNSSRFLAQASTTPSPKKPSTRSTPSQLEENVLVSEVVVTGVDGKLEDTVYKAIINTKPQHTTTRSKRQEDINAILATGYFSNVQAVPEDTPSGVRVKFEVKPNPIVTKVQVRANPSTNVSSVLPVRVVDEIFHEQYGKILNLRELQKKIKGLTLWYRVRGYTWADVIEEPRIDKKTGVVTLQVAEGVIENIRVRFVGEDGKDKDEKGKPIVGRVPNSIILQKFELKPGKVFNRHQVEKDLQALRSLGFFDDVNFSFAPSRNPSKVILLVNITENELASYVQDILKHQEQLRIYKSKKDEVGEAEVLQKLAGIYSEAGKPQQAIAKYEQALQIYKSKQDQANVTKLLNTIGNIYSRFKGEDDKKKAIGKYKEALQIYKYQQDLLGQAKILNNLGNTYYKLGYAQEKDDTDKKIELYKQAIDAYNQALPIFKTLNLPFWQALTLNNLALNYRELDEKDRSLEFFNQALVLWRQMKNNPSNTKLRSTASPGEGEGSISWSYYMSDTEGMVSNITIQIDQDLNKTPVPDIRFLEADTLFNLAGIYQSIGDYQQALYLVKDALQTSQSLSYSQFLNIYLEEKEKANFNSFFLLMDAFPLLSIAQLYSDIGEKQLALKYVKQALQKVVASSKADKELAKYSSLFVQLLPSIVFSDERQQDNIFDQAWANFFNQMLQDARQKAKDPDSQNFISSFELIIQTIIAQGYAESGKKQQALDLYNQVLSRLQSTKLGDQPTENSTNQTLSQWNEVFGWMQLDALKSKGEILFDLGRNQQALDTFNQVLSISKDPKYRENQAEALDLIGNVYSAEKRYQTALDFYNRALPLWQKVEDILKEADTHLAIARVERQQGNLAQAKTRIEKAIESIESERAQSSAAEQDKENNSSKQTHYKSYIELAKYLESKQNYYDFYLDLLMQLHKQYPSEGHNIQALQASERSQARSLLAIINRASDSPQGKVSTANKSNPNYLELAKLPQIKEIQQELLDDNTLLLEYALGEERSYLWAVTKNSITTYELPKRTDIEKAARQFYEFLTVPSLRIRTNKAAASGAKLSQMLLEPVSKQLGNKRLLVVADGILQYIPFSALPVPNSASINADNAENSSSSIKPLLVNHEIINLPSASTLAVIRRNSEKRQSPTKTLAIFADPVFSKEDERLTHKPSERHLQSKQNLSNLVSKREVKSKNTPVVEPLYPRLPGTIEEANHILSLVPPSEQLQKFNFAASRQALLALEGGKVAKLSRTATR